MSAPADLGLNFCNGCHQFARLGHECLACGRKKTPEQEVRDLERAIRPRVRMWRVKHWIGDYLMELLAGFAVTTLCIYAAVAWWVL